MKRISSFFLISLFFSFNSLWAITPSAPIAPVQQGIELRDVVGGYSYNQWGVPNTPNQSTPFGLFYQTPDSQISTYLTATINNLLNFNIAAAVPNMFDIGVPTTQIPYYQPSQSPAAGGFTSLDSLTANDIYRILTDTAPSLNIIKLAQLPAPMPIAQELTTVNYGGTATPPSSPLQQTASYNLNTLLLPLQYDGSTANYALNFIQMTAGIAQDSPVLDMTKLSKKDLANALANNSDLQNYLISLRSLAANQSVGISNLYFLYGERVPTAQKQAIPQNKNLPQLLSPLQFEHYIATRRYTDPNWQKGIQNIATPAELQRQNIYLLRDLLYVEYQRQMVDERILATLSTMQLANTAMQKTQLQQLAQKVQSQPPFGSPPPKVTSVTSIKS